MEFEYDPQKSQLNLNKHGVNFETAQEIWESEYVEFTAKSEYENRFACLGYLRGKLYTCIYTLRNNKIRIISCRRAREEEMRLYEEKINEK